MSAREPREVAGYPTLVGFGHYALETPRPVAGVKRAARQDRERHLDTALYDHD
jgi:hypothetical protein